MDEPADRDRWEGVPVFGVRAPDQPWVIRPSAYGLLEDSAGRIAVVRSADGTYLPGGGIEAGETPEAAIRREALEECGLLVRTGSWMTRAIQFAHSASERAHFEKRSTFIECGVTGADGTRLQPGHELLWVDSETAVGLLTHVSHCWAVDRWKERIGLI